LAAVFLKMPKVKPVNGVLTEDSMHVNVLAPVSSAFDGKGADID
jgi:hypothetical protein